MEQNEENNLRNHKICRLCATSHISGCHSAAAATIKYLDLVKSGQQKLWEMFEKIRFKNAEKQNDENPNEMVEKVKVLKRRSRPTKVPLNMCTASKIDNMDKPLERNKRERRPPKRLLDEINGKVLQRKQSLPIVIIPPSKEIDSSTLINSQSIAELRSASGEALGEVIEVASDASNISGSKDESVTLAKTYFVCEYCKAAFPKRYDFVQHIVTHKNCKYECSACLQNFQSKCSFDEHQTEMGHNGCGLIEFAAAAECTDENVNPPAINIVVGTNGQITSIIGNEINNKDNSSHCSEIDNKIKNESQSLNNIGKKLANSMYACLHCSKSFENIRAIRRHYQFVHVAMRAYKCESCPASFKTNYCLSVHQATHTGEKRFCCNFCEKTFITKHAWIIHTRIHTGEKPYKCKDCSKSFANRGNLMTHIRVHTGERPYKCTTCKLCFKALRNLKKHETIHLKGSNGIIIQNNKIVTKPISRQLYQSSSSSLLKPIKPEIRCVITIPPCQNLTENTSEISLNESFNVKNTTGIIDPTTSMELTINAAPSHVSSSAAATNSTPAIVSKSTYRFRCSDCFKQFNHCSTFKKHQRTHTGERPYKCHMCPKAFADPSNYNKHKILHKNATYALKIESEKQKIHNLRQLLEEQSSLDIKDSISLSPTSSAVSDPDPDGLEVLQRLDTRRQSFTSSLHSDDVVNIISDNVMNKECVSTWNSLDYSMRQPNIINTIGISEGRNNKLMRRNNADELPPSSFISAADNKQVICISYQDPTNPVGRKTTTFYAID